jgi:hypothetical protein
MQQTHTIAPRTPAYSTAGAILAVLAIASLLDIATAQALSQTDRAPSFAVRRRSWSRLQAVGAA